jgi:transposase
VVSRGGAGGGGDVGSQHPDRHDPQGLRVGWNTVMRAVLAAAEAVAQVRPTRVGINETVMTTGRLTTRRRQFLTALVCLDTSLVVAVVQGRDKGSATALLAEHAPDAEVVACDLFSGFKSAADTLESAVVVADVFHLVRLGLTALDEVRRRRQQQIHGHRGHKQDPLFKLRRVLRVGQERLEESKRHRSSTGSARPTPMTRSPPPGSPSTCSAGCTRPPTATPPTGAS